MIAAEIRINGQLIGSVYAHNIDYVADDCNVCHYDYDVQSIPHDEGACFQGAVEHDRRKGWEALMATILVDAETTKNKKIQKK